MADKERWITLKSGKKVKLDENGTIIAGFHGFLGKNIKRLKTEKEDRTLQPYSKPSKSINEYLKENNNDIVKAANQYIKENFAGKYVTTIINGREQDILFTGNSGSELTKYIKTKNKIYFLEDVPEVLQHYTHTEKSKYERKDFPNFHYFSDIIEKEINGKKVKAKIDVHVGINPKSRDENEAYYYHVTKIKDTKKSWKNEQDDSLTSRSFKKESPQHFLYPASDANIRPQYEVVNINIEILEDEPMNKKNTIIFDSKSKRSLTLMALCTWNVPISPKKAWIPIMAMKLSIQKLWALNRIKFILATEKGKSLPKLQRRLTDCPSCGSTTLTVRKIRKESSELAQSVPTAPIMLPICRQA